MMMTTPCNACQTLMEENDHNYVEGEGPVPCNIILYGEAPGTTEDKEMRPFVGRAGKLLMEILSEMGRDRADFYITNSIRVRPPGNRTPYMQELRECRDVCLAATLEKVRPEAIVCLGLAPWKQLTDNAGRSLQRDRRKIHYYKGIPVVCTYHPAYVLRNPVARDWMVADLESYLLDGLYQRQPLKVEFELV